MKIKLTPKVAIAEIVKLTKLGMPIYIQGSVGLGKTSIARQVADQRLRIGSFETGSGRSGWKNQTAQRHDIDCDRQQRRRPSRLQANGNGVA